MSRGPVLLFAGGGSGGHISPGLAVAERVAEIDPAARCVFACSTRDIDRVMLADAAAPYEPVAAAPFALRPRGLIRFAVGFLRGRRAAADMIRRLGVDRVIAMGGFVSAPVVAAAVRLRVPVTLVNLDDPPGRANRWIARRCEQVLSVGTPIRRRARAPGPPPACRAMLGLDPDRPTLLVTGASQGARSINAMVTSLGAAEPRLFDGWQVAHLCGAGEEAAVAGAWAAAGVSPVVVQPFIHDVGRAWGAADLAVSRAGASSVAEAWLNGVPTLFMPYPHHRDRHQHRNAAPMVAAGGAVLAPDLPDAQANLRGAGATLAGLMRDEGRRRTMRRNLAAHRAPDAASTIAERVLAR